MTELKSLVYGSSAPYIDQSMFPSTVSYYYWSSTPHYGGSFAYGVDFGDGNPDYYAKVDILYVRCVSP
jgi:hypothetical protein